MEDKRTLLAIILCLGVLLGWNVLSEKMGWIQPPVAPIAEQNLPLTSMEAGQATSAITTPLPVFTPSKGHDVIVNTPLYEAVFYSGGGTLTSFKLKKYALNESPDSPRINLVSPEAAATAPLGITVNAQPSWSTGQWSFTGESLNLEAGQQSTLTFVGLVDGVRITRIMVFSADSYLITEKVLLRTETEQARTVRLGFTVGASPFGSESDYDMTRVAWSDDGSYSEETSPEDQFTEVGIFPWAAVLSNYFMTAIAPASDQNITIKMPIVQNTVWRVGLEPEPFLIQPNTDFPVDVAWYYGPKERAMLEVAPNDLRDAVDLGMFSVISHPLLIFLEFFYNYVHNWGIAILILTFFIRLAFWPLSQKSYKSMKAMQKLQPLMLKLREKYADDKVALQRETMQLYKTYKVNPLGGCLPILVQIPVFIGLYQALLNSIELRHAVFIEYLPFTSIPWLTDLAAKDPFYITPILMGITMLLQQRLSPPPADPMQQKVMMFMPIIFTAMFLNFPAGLVIYWLFSNILSITQQWLIMRKI